MVQGSRLCGQDVEFRVWSRVKDLHYVAASERFAAVAQPPPTVLNCMLLFGLHLIGVIEVARSETCFVNRIVVQERQAATQTVTQTEALSDTDRYGQRHRQHTTICTD